MWNSAKPHSNRRCSLCHCVLHGLKGLRTPQFLYSVCLFVLSATSKTYFLFKTKFMRIIGMVRYIDIYKYPGLICIKKVTDASFLWLKSRIKYTLCCFYYYPRISLHDTGDKYLKRVIDNVLLCSDCYWRFSCLRYNSSTLEGIAFPHLISVRHSLCIATCTLHVIDVETGIHEIK